MSMRRYAAALNLSEDALRRWRQLIEDGAVDKDWRALLHPAARPALSTSANDSAKADRGLTDAAEPRSRRSFTPEEKAAIVRETRRGGITVSAVARRHRIVPSVIFRWRAEMGIGSRRKPADLALVTGETGALILEGLMPQPEGTVRMQLGDGRCVFVSAGADRQDVERLTAPQETQT
jgi:transposase-like protein